MIGKICPHNNNKEQHSVPHHVEASTEIFLHITHLMLSGCCKKAYIVGMTLFAFNSMQKYLSLYPHVMASGNAKTSKALTKYSL